MQNLFIYLSGSIKKRHSNNSENSSKDILSFWMDDHIQEMKELFLEKGVNVVFLNPASRSDDLSDEKSLFGRDILQVYLSNCILVDARGRRGLGVGYEIATANFKNIPIFSWVPYETHYRPKEMEMLGQKLYDWTHPFLFYPSTGLFENLEEAVNYISNFEIPTKEPINIKDFILPAIQHYINTNLERDKEMYSLIESYNELKEIMRTIISIK